jgi:Skp family chaperone for outer membrane proteins
MSELEKQVKRIQDKLQQLLKQQQLLSKENDELKKELSAYKKDTITQKSAIDELKQQASILKMNSVEMNDTDKKEFEKRLNHYIKEIDRCIAMLSS